MTDEKMFFDEERVVELYNKYVTDNSLADEFHEATKGLIEVVAVSVSSENLEDLIQEGHAKLQKVLINRLYVPSRGSLYSFLSTTLRNHMIDVLRKNSKFGYTFDVFDVFRDVESHPLNLSGIDNYVDELSDYMVRRFPTLSEDIISGAITYVIEGVKEDVHDGVRGTLRTMELMYNLDRTKARILYYSVLCTVRMMLHEKVNWRENMEEALSISSNCDLLEFTLIPEVVLLLGFDQAHIMCNIFCGANVKF